MEDTISIQHTIFEPYETIIFDCDNVLWDCFQPNGQSTGVYTAVPPFKREAGNIVTASNGAVIRLQEGIEGLLQALDKANKNLGIVSRSEAPGVTFAAQPAVMLLKQFCIYKYFNYDIIIKWGINKAEYVKPNGKTLFIDDDQQNLGEVQHKDQVDVLWRKSFVNWNQTLSPVQSSLHFSFMKLGWEVIKDNPQFEEVKNKLENLDRFQLVKIADDAGLIFDINDIESVEFQSMKLDGYKNRLEAMYKVVFHDPEDNQLYVTNNFVFWDGNEFDFDVSGTCEPLSSIQSSLLLN